MGLLTSSGSLVTTTAAGKAVGTWAVRMPFGGSTEVDLWCRWAPLVAVTEFEDSATTVVLSWVLSVRGHKGFGRERGGEKKCPYFFVDRGSLG